VAITAYTGPPGSGKSHALMGEVILSAVMKGRTVLTNVDGVNPEKVRELAAKKMAKRKGFDPDKLGSVQLFDREDLKKPEFFPTEETGDANTTIKGGMLVAIDEWALAFPRRASMRADPVNANLVPFLRWHRHFVDADGQSTDVVIATQLISDIDASYRGVVERSFKFQKLSAVGLNKAYKYHVYEGPEQKKGTSTATRNGTFKKEIFALYKSYDTDGDAKETSTDSRAGLFSKGFLALGGLALCAIGFGLYSAFGFFSTGAEPDQGPQAAQPYAASGLPQNAAPGEAEIYAEYMPANSPFRIVGTIAGDGAPLVVIADDNGTTRLEPYHKFEFRDDRPISGIVDGQRVVASDRIVVSGQQDVEF